MHRDFTFTFSKKTLHAAARTGNPTQHIWVVVSRQKFKISSFHMQFRSIIEYTHITEAEMAALVSSKLVIISRIQILFAPDFPFCEII